MNYWWIKNSKGELMENGRGIYDDGSIFEAGAPELQWWKKDAKKLCFKGEKPIKVKIVEVT